MPFNIIREDITKVKCDAIVNAANTSLLGGGGVDGAIHKAAGRGLLAECKTLGGCGVGEAKLTKGYNLPSKYIIHTVGPIWKGGRQGEEKLLRSCYSECLRIADENKFESLAFPIISAGAYGYPKAEAFEIAVDEIKKFLETSDMLVTIVVFDKYVFELSREKFGDVEAFIDSNYTESLKNKFGRTYGLFNRPRRDECECETAAYMPDFSVCANKAPTAVSAEPKFVLDESFSQMLLRLIDEKGMTDAECYKKANIDRKLFSKIRSDVHYKPSKATAVAFAVSLELSLHQTEELLMKAGYALSDSFMFDVIVKYYIERKIFDIYTINQVLFSHDQKLLGIQ